MNLKLLALHDSIECWSIMDLNFEKYVWASYLTLQEFAVLKYTLKKLETMICT